MAKYSDPSADRHKDRDSIRVLARGLSLLRAFRPRNAPLTNGELSDATGLPRPTVSRITATLLRLGYLEYFAERAQYRLAPSVLTLGFGVLVTLDIRLRARERMRSFADREDVLVVLSVPDGMSMVCQVVCPGPGALTVRLHDGSRVALPHSAMGCAWFASLEASQREAVWKQIKHQYPGRGVKSELDAAARQIERSGFCIMVSKLEPDLLGAATIMRLGAAFGPYVLGCAAPAFRYRRQQSRTELGVKLMALRRQIEDDMMIPDAVGR